MIYFDNSATTFYKPTEVINAAANTMRFLSANPGRSGHALAAKAGLLVHKTRAKAAAYLGLEHEERVVFTHNCTMALNLAILGTVKTGGHVITTAYEHNSVLRPLFELARKGSIALSVIAPGSSGVVTTAMIEKELRPETYLIAINHISNVTGAKTPIAQIGALARANGILLSVDGAQSVGYIDVDMQKMNIDLLSVAPHKGLHAPQGIGILAIGSRAEVSPLIFGGTGTSSESVYQPEELPEALESGTLPTPAIAGLNAALSWSEKNRSFVKEKITELNIYLLDNLKKIDGVSVYTPPENYNGIAAFNIKSMTSVEAVDILSEQYDIAARGGLHCAPLIHKHLGTLDTGIIRVSLGFENTYAEINVLLNAIKEML